MKFTLATAVFALCLLVVAVVDAGSRTEHVVKSGDSIAGIARFYGVDQEALRELNGLGKNDFIHPGDVLAIPDVLVEGWTRSHVVKQGDTLIRISKRYRVDIKELERLNKIDPAGQLRIGQRLVIPKGKRVDSQDAVGRAEDANEPQQKRWDGRATFVRVRDSEQKTMTMFDRRGRVRTYARRTISRLARSTKGRVRWLNTRLIQLLGKVAEQFPGQKIEIISGFRPHRRGRRRSQHAKGRAVDFRVRDVSNLELYNFIKTFPKVGVGYYPNSTFVHLDVRDRKYLWTDVSGPGEPARYVRAGEPGSAETAIIEDAEGLPDPENFPTDGLDDQQEPGDAK